MRTINSFGEIMNNGSPLPVDLFPHAVHEHITMKLPSANKAIRSKRGNLLAIKSIRILSSIVLVYDDTKGRLLEAQAILIISVQIVFRLEQARIKEKNCLSWRT